MLTNWFLTGRPGVGKTTLVRRVLQQLGPLSATGFYTQEIRVDRRRVGFRIVTMAGQTAVLAHVEIQSEQRVSRYGVDVAAFERAALPSLAPTPEAALVVVDEIGKMECFSRAFREAVVNALDSETPVLATIARRGDRFIEGLKSREDVWLIEVTRANRDRLVEELITALRERVVEAQG